MTYINVIKHIRVMNWPELGMKREMSCLNQLNFCQDVSLLILSTLQIEILTIPLSLRTQNNQSEVVY